VYGVRTNVRYTAGFSARGKEKEAASGSANGKIAALRPRYPDLNLFGENWLISSRAARPRIVSASNFAQYGLSV
jgi:hypothetical protein